MFKFDSELLLSKSWLNRALIIQSYANEFSHDFSSESDDVVHLKTAIQQLKSGHKEFDLGQGGTSFRFFCLLLSRHQGSWIIKAHPRLLERPHSGLKVILDQLDTLIEFSSDHARIVSKGWKVPQTIICEAQESSQFVSALLLNCWDLENELEIQIQGSIVSEDYLKMTLRMLQDFGMNLKTEEASQKIWIAKKQIPLVKNTKPEVDVSSAFSLAAAAVIDGDMTILNWNSYSIQPDMAFLKIFDQMQISYLQTETSLKIQKQKCWKGAKANLNLSPDLFPVLAILCGLAQGPSELFGAEQLKHKESNRLQKTKELLDLAGFQSELKFDGLKIQGLSLGQDKAKKIIFDPDHDHRMAMAAGLLKLAGFNIQIKDAAVVNKSYSSFWKDTGITP